MENIRKIAFVLVMIAYVAFPLYTISSYESVLTGGEVFRFKLEPIDPYDAFRGKYIILRYDGTRLKKEETDKLRSGQQIYVSLANDSLGYAYFHDWSNSPPNESAYIETKVDYVYGNKFNIHLPFDRYYLNEELAPIAETHYRQLLGGQQDSIPNAYIDIRVKEGKSNIEELYFKGEPIGEYLRGLE